MLVLDTSIQVVNVAILFNLDTSVRHWCDTILLF